MSHYAALVDLLDLSGGMVTSRPEVVGSVPPQPGEELEAAMAVLRADGIAQISGKTSGDVAGDIADLRWMGERMRQCLDRRGIATRRLRRAGSPAWVRISGGRGTYGPRRASVGADYDFDRVAVEAGVDFRLSETGDVTGSVSLRHVRGSADVSAPASGCSRRAFRPGTPANGR